MSNVTDIQEYRARKAHHIMSGRIMDTPDLHGCTIAAVERGIDEGIAALNSGATFREAWNVMRAECNRPDADMNNFPQGWERGAS